MFESISEAFTPGVRAKVKGRFIALVSQGRRFGFLGHGHTHSRSNKELLMDSSKVQVKCRVDAGVVSAFKARCVDGGISMSAALSRLMEGRNPVTLSPCKSSCDIGS